MAIGPAYEWFLTFVLIKNDASHPCISLPCMVCLPIFAIKSINVNINHSWICKGLQTSNGSDHGIYKLTETLKPQIGILNLSSHALIQENSNRCRVNIPQVPQSTNISTTSFINRWFFRVEGMFLSGYVGVFLQIQLFLPDRHFPWFTFFFVNFMMEVCS